MKTVFPFPSLTFFQRGLVGGKMLTKAVKYTLHDRERGQSNIVTSDFWTSTGIFVSE